MKRTTAWILALLSLAAVLAIPVSADRVGIKYSVFWAYGTVDEYYLDPKLYAVGEIPPVPDVIPTKEDATRLFHFVHWDRPPEPVKGDSFYYAMYEVYEKKYAMNHDTVVTIADATVHLDVLSGKNVDTLSNPDVNQNDLVSIQDTTLILDYLKDANPPIVSAKALLQEGKQQKN